MSANTEFLSADRNADLQFGTAEQRTAVAFKEEIARSGSGSLLASAIGMPRFAVRQAGETDDVGDLSDGYDDADDDAAAGGGDAMLICVSTVQNTDLRLTARLAPGLRGMILDYAVENRDVEALYLFNLPHGFPDNDGVYSILPGAAVERDGECVVIGLKIVAPPPEVFVESLNIPFVTRVERGGRYDGRIDLPSLLENDGPYREFLPAPSGRSMQCELFFELGYFVAHAGSAALAEQYRSDKGECNGFDTFPIGSQRLLRVGPLGRTTLRL